MYTWDAILINFCFSLVNLCFLTKRPHLTTQKDRGKMVSLPLVNGSWAFGRWWGLEEVTRVGLMCPEGIIANRRDVRRLHSSLSTLWGHVRKLAAYRQEEGLHLGTEIGWPWPGTSWLPERTVSSSCAPCFGSRRWLTWTNMMFTNELNYGFVLSFHLGQWSSVPQSPHDRPSY